MEGPREALLAYMAGIVDGEGCITIKRRGRKTSPNHQPTLGVANTDERLIQFLLDNFGGSVTYKSATERHSQTWTWTLSTHPTVVLLGELLPYLIIKKAQAELVLEYVTKFVSFKGGDWRRGRRVVSAQQMAMREDYYSQIRALNQKGPPAETERAGTSTDVKRQSELRRRAGEVDGNDQPRLRLIGDV